MAEDKNKKESVASASKEKTSVKSAAPAEKSDKAKDFSDKKKPAAVSKEKKAVKEVKKLLRGQAHIQSTYNNTIVTLTDLSGNVLGWASAGHLGFKGAKKATPYAASLVVARVAEKVNPYGMREVDVYLNGIGSGREAAVRAFQTNGLKVMSIKDMTPMPHNGCRSKKPRRV